MLIDIKEEFPASLKVLAECEPVYEELPAEDITGCRSLDELPDRPPTCIATNRNSIINFLVGPDRTQTNVVRSPWRQK